MLVGCERSHSSEAFSIRYFQHNLIYSSCACIWHRRDDMPVKLGRELVELVLWLYQVGSREQIQTVSHGVQCFYSLNRLWTKSGFLRNSFISGGTKQRWLILCHLTERCWESPHGFRSPYNHNYKEWNKVEAVNFVCLHPFYQLQDSRMKQEAE